MCHQAGIRNKIRKGPLMHYGGQRGIWRKVMLISALVNENQTSSDLLWILLNPRDPELPRGGTRKPVGLVGEWGAARWGEGWLLYFLWHGLRESQRKWISNDGSKPKIRNTFSSSCGSHVSMEILLRTLTLFSVAGLPLIGFFYSKKRKYFHIGHLPYNASVNL